MDQNLKTILDFIQHNENLSAEEKTLLVGLVSNVDKELSITTFKLDRTDKVKRTTAILLEETIEELEQKRKAVEMQNRELEIEAALERVRAVAMGMKKPEDMLDICRIISEQLEQFGVAHIRNVQTVIINKEKGTYHNYQYFMPYKKEILEVTEYHKSPVSLDLANRMLESADGFFTGTLTGDVFKQWRTYRKQEEQFPDPLLDEVNSAHYHFYSIGPGGLGITLYHPLTEKGLEIFKRFHQVFTLAYHRFRDIEKAEAQVREAQIELALERVRARTMSMHKSVELKEVIQKVYDQFGGLNILVEHAGFILDYKDRDDMHIWLADHQKGLPSEITIPYFDSPHWNSYREAKAKGENLFVNLLDFEEKNRFYKALFKLIPPLPDKAVQSIFNKPGLTISTVLLDSVGLYIENYSGIPFTSQENAVLMRFGKVFQQTYTRFLDLQKAEAQAREAQIQLALERVRARTMAMQSSEELAEVSYLLNKQVVDLGIPTRGCAFNIYGENESTEWFSNLDGTLPTYKTPRDNIFLKYYQAGQRGETLLIEEFGGERIRLHYKYLMSLQLLGNDEKEEEEILKVMPERQIDHVAYFRYGYLLFITLVPAPEAHEIFQRFSKEFEQTYTRFLDLQKAEAQAREAQTELSLERIRAQVTAMRESSELLDIVVTMRSEFTALGHEAHYFWHMRWLPEEYEKAMTSGDGTRIGMVMTLPRHIHGDIKLVADWEKSEEPSVVLAMDVETAINYVDKMITLGDFQQVDPQAPTLDDIRHIGGLTFVMARTTHGEIGFSLPGTVHHPPAESITTLNRFASVFDLAYKRFEDLKSTELQHREAQIELALERTRNQSMRMQHSSELNDISKTFHEQLLSLGIDSEFSFVWLPDAVKQEHMFWATWIRDINDVAQYESKSVKYPLDKTEPGTAKCYMDWESGQPIHETYIPPDQIDSFFAAWEALLEGAEQFKPELFPEGIYYTEAYMKYGCFGIDIRRQLTSEEKEIIRRFSVEFERTYTRFLDLQKAESQAREARIEAALERVRSRTMGMYRSDELQEAAGLLFQQVEALGVPVFGTGFNIWDTDRKFATAWMSGKDRMQPPFKTSSSEDIYALIFEAAQKGDSLFVKEQGGEALKTHYKYLNSIPVFKEIADKMAMAGQSFPTFQIMHCAFFSHGYLMFISFDPVPDAYDIFKRFAKVFEQTYTRFLDLQKAEAQAREATKRASVDRVRAEIASMRTTKDLERITPLVWSELTTLGVPFIRSGVFIMEEANHQIQVHLSTPAGKAIAAFQLNYEASVQSRQIVSHWREKKVFIDHMDEAAFAEYTKNLVQQGALAGDEKYVTENHPTDLYLHFLPFAQGMLYVGNDAALKEEELQLVQDLADAFSTAYARYEDFNKLEAAKLQVDKALVNLKQAQQQLVQSEKMASLGELTAGIAHEIQNPLNFVNNFSEVSSELVDEMNEELSKGNLEDALEIATDLKQNLEKITHHGKRAGEIVKGMLQHSRTSSGQKELTDLNVLADEYLRLAYHGLRAKDKTFNSKMETDFDPNLPKIEVVPQDIGRVILNLITNAFYVVNEKAKQGIEGYEPTVSVSTKKKENAIEISVKDNGNGIPEHIKEKIFQPFFTTKPTGQGTGLGLSLSYDIVKAHGGEIKVKTKENEGLPAGQPGTEFTIIFPA